MDNRLAIYRLTALWAFIEVGIGGILHAAKIPITGFVVGAMAVTILTLIARLSDENKRATILQAVIVVVLIKATVTPHSGIGAYLAVLFQGAMSMLFFPLLNFKLAAILVATLSMAESASQKNIYSLSSIRKNANRRN